MFRVILCMSPLEKVPFATFYPPLEVPVWHIFFKKRLFQVDSCIKFYRLMQLIFSTSLKGIIRKECQSFTNHGHDKTPPAVFSPLSLWLTLPRDMGVSHTLWPPSIARAILACLWFAQGSKKIKTAEPFYDVQGDYMYSILPIDATYFFNITIDKLTIYML